jgi:hypothetical protein
VFPLTLTVLWHRERAKIAQEQRFLITQQWLDEAIAEIERLVGILGFILSEIGAVYQRRRVAGTL